MATFYKHPCKSTCLYNAPNSHTADFTQSWRSDHPKLSRNFPVSLRTIFSILPALLQKLVGNFLIFGRNLAGSLAGILRDLCLTHNKGSKNRAKNRRIFRGKFRASKKIICAKFVLQTCQFSTLPLWTTKMHYLEHVLHVANMQRLHPLFPKTFIHVSLTWASTRSHVGE